MTAQQLSIVEQLLRDSFWPGMEFHHGKCVGADCQAGAIADKIGYRIGIHPPINKKNVGFCRWDFTYDEAPYAERDRDIVLNTQSLIATPHTPYEIIRSGTWTTVRFARKLERPIYIVKPNGSVFIENL